jgi:hypothetical protein
LAEKEYEKRVFRYPIELGKEKYYKLNRRFEIPKVVNIIRSWSLIPLEKIENSLYLKIEKEIL